MFLDETGITNNLLRRYGRAPRGARVHDHAPGGRWQTSTFLAALRVTGLTAPGVFDGAIDGESFRAYIEQILVPTLQPGDIVIADNLGAHKVAGIQRAIQAAGDPLRLDEDIDDVTILIDGTPEIACRRPWMVTKRDSARPGARCRPAGPVDA